MRFLSLAFALLSGTALLCAAIPNLTLEVRIDPLGERLRGSCRITNWPAQARQFYLAKGLTIDRLEVDGRRVAVHRPQGAAALDFTVDALPVTLPEGGAHEVRVRYHGQVASLKGQTNGHGNINGISKDLVELALYAGWYPSLGVSELFTFELRARLPQAYVATSNGRQAPTAQGATRVWVSEGPATDIALIASKAFQTTAIVQGGFTAQAYFARAPKPLIEDRLRKLALAYQAYEAHFGPAAVTGQFRFAYSPRPGWAYSRVPLFVTSEEEALEAQGAPGLALFRDLKGNAHEVAHFWWCLAGVEGPDDWINEGLAEFSAFREARAQFGPILAQEMVQRYRQSLQRCSTSESIPASGTNSPDRYANRYQKTTLLFLALEKAVGQARLDHSLARFHAAFKGARKADTAAFLQYLEEDLGAKAMAPLKEGLVAPGWTAQRLDTLVASLG